MKKNRDEIDGLGLFGLVIILICVALACGCCTPHKVVVSDARMTIKDGKVKVERTGPIQELKDTIITGKFITRMR